MNLRTTTYDFSIYVRPTDGRLAVAQVCARIGRLSVREALAVLKKDRYFKHETPDRADARRVLTIAQETQVDCHAGIKVDERDDEGEPTDGCSWSYLPCDPAALDRA